MKTSMPMKLPITRSRFRRLVKAHGFRFIAFKFDIGVNCARQFYYEDFNPALHSYIKIVKELKLTPEEMAQDLGLIPLKEKVEPHYPEPLIRGRRLS